MNIAVFISGGGSNLQSIIDAVESGLLEGVQIKMVIADREAGGLKRAQKHNIPFQLVNRKAHKEHLSEALLEALPEGIDYIVLAGFLSIIGEQLIEAFPQRIINIHPALLPKYGGKGMYGMNVHRAVVENHEAESGCTVHIVDGGVDTGQILFQRSVPVIVTDEGEDVQENVLAQEHEILPKAIAYLALLHESGLPNPSLVAGKLISDEFLSLGIQNYWGACHYVKNLPYERNSERNFNCVLREKRGVCSTKHALLKALADELDIPNVELTLGIYKMDGTNTPGVGSVLNEAELEYLPEAHSYLKVNNTLLDFTRSESFTADFRVVLLQEQAYLPNQIGEWKVNVHKDYLNQWLTTTNSPKSLEEIWSIREACIEALFNN